MKFSELKDNQAIFCETKEEQERILRMLHKEGYLWESKDSIILNDKLVNYSCGPVIYLDGNKVLWSSIDMAEDLNLHLIPSTSFRENWTASESISDNKMTITEIALQHKAAKQAAEELRQKRQEENIRKKKSEFFNSFSTLFPGIVEGAKNDGVEIRLVLKESHNFAIIEFTTDKNYSFVRFHKDETVDLGEGFREVTQAELAEFIYEKIIK